MRKNIWTFFFACTLFSDLAMAAEPSIKVRVTEGGFQAVADEIKKTALSDISGLAIPDQSGRILALRYDVKGIKVEGKFDDIKLTPKENSLEIAVKIKNFKLNISEFSLTEYLPLPWVTKCRNLVLTAGSDDPIAAELGIMTKVTNGQLKFDFQKIRFHNIRQSYSVHGPDSCSLPLPVGSIMQLFVHEFLLQAEPLLEVALKFKMLTSEDKIAVVLKEAMTIKRQFEVPEITGVPVTTLDITGSPLDLAFDRGGLELSYYVDVKRHQSALAPTPSSPNTFANIGILANISINEDFINRLLAQVLPTGTTEIEVDNKLLPGADEILTASVLSSFIPDLSSAPMDSEKVRVRIKVQSTPKVAVISNPQSLSLDVKDLVITFMISQNGQWMDYYIFKAKVAGSVGMKITDQQKLMVRAIPGFSYDFVGDWAPGYTPTIPGIETETIRLTVDSVLESFYEQESIFSLDVPVFPVGGGVVTVGNLGTIGHFVDLDIVKVAR